MDGSFSASRDILAIASQYPDADEQHDYSVPVFQKWAFIVNVNAIMLFAICILLIFITHQQQFDFLIYKFTNLIGLAIVSLAVVAISVGLDYAAVGMYRGARGKADPRTQLGQVLDYTSFFCVLSSFAVSGWTGFGFLDMLFS